MATDSPMQLGMVGLGRMGANLVRRLMRDGHRCVGGYLRPVVSVRQAVRHVPGDSQALPEGVL